MILSALWLKKPNLSSKQPLLHMELYFATSLATREDPDLLDDTEIDDDELLVEDGVDSKIFEALGFQTMQDIQEMSGDGRCGPYGQRPKSNWFPASLSSPSQDFRMTFQYVLCQFFLNWV